MKTKLYLLLAVITFGCSDQDDDHFIPSATQELAVQDFIWKSMNIWYFWKDTSENVNDDSFSSNDAYRDFLSSFSTPEELFREGILVDEDRFSYITSDYNSLFNSQQGISTTNGIEYGLYRIGDGNDAVGVVRYINSDSDASSKNIKRGDIFYAVNGINLFSNKDTEENNYRLIRQDQITLSFADIVDNVIVPNGIEIDFTRNQLTENPVHINKVIEQGGTKIGYLMYNQFTATFNDELNDAFASLKSQGITELVLDLRYNPGGSVRTSTYLASMITGQFNGSLYSKLRYNDLWQSRFRAEQLSYHFTNRIDNSASISSLNLTRIYILTSRRTASASELLINGLIPYINVIQIGDVTVGKNQASITLLDDPRGRIPYSGKTRQEASPLHTYALQPIVSRTENSLGFSDYGNGLSPDVILKESITNFGTLGDINEPMLAKAIEEITGTTSKSLLRKPEIKSEFISDSKMMQPTKDNMYID